MRDPCCENCGRRECDGYGVCEDWIPMEDDHYPGWQYEDEEGEQ